MKSRLTEHEFQSAHEIFSLDHDRLRGELLGRLEQAEIETAQPVRHYRPFVKAALAAAAVVALAVVSLQVFDTDKAGTSNTIIELISPDTAWASALEQAQNVHSVHLLFSTPHGNDEGAMVEVWWQRPNQYRMEFDNGLTMAGNGNETYKWTPTNGKLTINGYTGPGLEVFILRELGHMFATDIVPMDEWIERPEPISVEDVTYRGIACQKFTLMQDDQCYEYILDKHTSVIYEGVRRTNGPHGRVMSRMEVLEVDRQWPDSLFTIQPEESEALIIDQR